MSTFFCDTSALIKVYLSENGSSWMRTQCHKKAGHIIAISQATLVEAVAAICRRVRDPNPAHRITPDERNKLITLFRGNVNKRYSITIVTTDIYKNAGNLCRIYELRAYDAVQLACALVEREELIDSGLSAPIFVSADNKLLDIAALQGFTVDNPNNHP
jgi:predicted nucleic acid-binding protein